MTVDVGFGVIYTFVAAAHVCKASVTGFPSPKR